MKPDEMVALFQQRQRMAAMQLKTALDIAKSSTNVAVSRSLLAQIDVEQHPTFAYLTKHFYYAPHEATYWKGVFRLATFAAALPHNVMIYGPTGSGKEIFARAIACASSPDNSPRCVAVNMTSLPDYLIESELFGHEAGAFTGAIRERAGLMVEARDGVMFLDEIGDMPLTLQPKLLRVLQDRTVRKVGSDKTTPISCKFVCASHRNLRDGQKFRTDLYWRLAEIEITLRGWNMRDGEVDWIIKRKLDAEWSILDDSDITEIRQQFQTSGTGGYRELKALVLRKQIERFSCEKFS